MSEDEDTAEGVPSDDGEESDGGPEADVSADTQDESTGEQAVPVEDGSAGENKNNSQAVPVEDAEPIEEDLEEITEQAEELQSVADRLADHDEARRRRPRISR
ncbi:MAG: hypothetical protein U5K37_02915 [Natrialbaceae archaeon]|nr:hypothetical protein [Natrialbaceae archaeon]